MSDEPTQETSIDGYQVDLDGCRHVWVARRDDDYLVQFKNSEGNLTHLRLSHEAADALAYLLNDNIKDPGEVIKHYMRVISTVKTQTEREHKWVAVERDTAPQPS